MPGRASCCLHNIFVSPTRLLLVLRVGSGDVLLREVVAEEVGDT